MDNPIPGSRDRVSIVYPAVEFIENQALFRISNSHAPRFQAIALAFFLCGSGRQVSVLSPPLNEQKTKRSPSSVLTSLV